MKLLCPSSYITEGQSRGFAVGELRLLAVRQQGRVYLYENRCPHRGVPLEWVVDQFLDHSGSLLQCSTHGALFLIDNGECVAGPCAGQSLQALGCLEDAAGVWLKLS